MVFSHSTSSQLTQELQVILGVYRQEPGAPRSPPLATLIPCLLLTAQLSYLGPCQSPMGHACVCPSPLMNPFLGFITFLVAITCWPWAQEETTPRLPSWRLSVFSSVPPTSQLFLAAHPTSGSRCLLCSCVLYQVASASSRESGSGLSNSPLSGSLSCSLQSQFYLPDSRHMVGSTWVLSP